MSTLTVKMRCSLCDTEHELVVDADGYDDWQNGRAFIQDALSELPADQRELLISGVCGKCFNELFGDDEEEY